MAKRVLRVVSFKATFKYLTSRRLALSNRAVGYPIRMLLLALLESSRGGALKFRGWLIIDIHSTRLKQLVKIRRKLPRADLYGLAAKSKRFVRLEPFREEIQNERAELDLLFIIDSVDRESVYQIAKAANESVIFVGARDLTLPLQVDQRVPPATHLDTDIFDSAQPVTKALFTENLDSNDSLFRAVPGGVLPRPFTGSVRILRGGNFAPSVPTEGKIAVVTHRVRQGAQWEKRRVVSDLAEGEWSDFCHVESGELSFRGWKRVVSEYPFGLCVEGGGITPSPKFFDFLCLKTIPIITESAVSNIHEQLPCVVVSSWEARALDRKKLETDYQRLAEDWESWDTVFQKLRSSYWRDYMKNCHSDKGV
jgi:hypothetical protein